MQQDVVDFALENNLKVDSYYAQPEVEISLQIPLKTSHQFIDGVRGNSLSHFSLTALTRTAIYTLVTSFLVNYSTTAVCTLCTVNNFTVFDESAKIFLDHENKRPNINIVSLI